MNLYFLVEGEITEKLVYRAWIKHTFPAITMVETVSEMASNSCYIISGQGYPQTLKRIHDSLLDIKDNPAIDHFFICIDSDEQPYSTRVQQITTEVTKQEASTGVREGNSSFLVHTIVQHCCIETWFLGHTQMMQGCSPSAQLRSYQQFFDVGTNDPELMGAYTFQKKAHFHLEYVKEIMLSQSPRQRYRKRKPGIVLEKSYMETLRERTTSTGHLPSLQKLFTTWSAIAPSTPAQ